MLEAVPAACDRGHPEVCDDPVEGIDDCRDRGIADHVETGGDLGFAACPQMRFDGVGIEVARPGAARCVGVRLVQPGGARAERSVDEQVAGQSTGTGLGDPGAGLCCRGDRLTPVADHFDAVPQTGQLQPVVQSADLRSRAFVHRDDARRGQCLQRRGARLGELFAGE
ncbi:hypothetical protein IWGMT90018_27490 [Mycobacterium kiyosense]|nr:hypothetical protein IWGMT90018_27490 [Mycobacterium kiyosense]